MRIYLKYLYYIFMHKYYMFKECWKLGLYLHAFTHDLSKLRPSEFFAYANFYFKVSTSAEQRRNKSGYLPFEYAWLRHQKRNPHHWNHFILVSDGYVRALPMPEKYVKQLVADWRALGAYTGKSPYDYYKENIDKFIMHEDTVELLLKYIKE